MGSCGERRPPAPEASSSDKEKSEARSKSASYVAAGHVCSRSLPAGNTTCIARQRLAVAFAFRGSQGLKLCLFSFFILLLGTQLLKSLVSTVSSS